MLNRFKPNIALRHPVVQFLICDLSCGAFHVWEGFAGGSVNAPEEPRYTGLPDDAPRINRAAYACANNIDFRAVSSNGQRPAAIVRSETIGLRQLVFLRSILRV